MRIPTIVLLSSVALSLLVTAETTPPAVAAAAASAIAPISANVAAPADTTTQPEDMEPLNSLKMKEDGKTYPVGKGIVFTKTTFVVDDKNKDKSATKDGRAEFSVQGLLGDLLGIDINLGGGGGKKKKKGPPSDSGSTTTTPPAEETDPDYIPLYGDDGYKPRSVPKGCPELSFLNQMIWDQQGNNGSIEGPASTTPPVSSPADASASSPSEADADKNASEIEKRDPPAAAAEDKSNKATTTTEPKDKDEKEKLITKINTSAATVIDPKDLFNGKVPKEFDTKGIRICLLGGCGKDDDDEDEDNDGKKKRRRVHHKQKKFLKQFKGKALKIDGRTGCPIPSDA
ncbi:hypothetical protein EC957_000136 [Mortierella hygrophila]|uniref:Uncharacterized protein n=1 Tax=Mortierella hygrophila TaxID=979708 RepID=A0A9P6FGS7_9FUNG|nr:hypothetical protein EC957_000136 [Mortierella hygrophila]